MRYHLHVELPLTAVKTRIVLEKLSKCWSLENWELSYHVPAIDDVEEKQGIIAQAKLYKLGKGLPEISPTKTPLVKVLGTDDQFLAILEEDWLPSRDLLCFYEATKHLLSERKVQRVSAIPRSIDPMGVNPYRLSPCLSSWSFGSWLLYSNIWREPISNYCAFPDLGRVKKLYTKFASSDEVFTNPPVESAWFYESSDV